jgi:hypothetical protein
VLGSSILCAGGGQAAIDPPRLINELRSGAFFLAGNKKAVKKDSSIRKKLERRLGGTRMGEVG